MARLHRPARSLQYVETHVLFLHGLNGSYASTFQSSGETAELWPAWLSNDRVAVWGVDYEAASSHWQAGGAMHLTDRAQNLLPLIANCADLAAGDLILVGYSLGGIVIKQLLRLADDERNSDARIGNFIRRVRKIAFIATPHFGSDQASFAKRFSLAVRPRETTAGLGRNDGHLRELNRWYRTFSRENHIENLVLYETQALTVRIGPRFLNLRLPVPLGVIVKPDSSDPGLPHPAQLIAIDADHVSIVQPKDRNCETYVHIQAFVEAPSSGVHRDAYVGARLDAVQTAIQEQTAAIKDARVFGETASREISNALEAIRARPTNSAEIGAGVEYPVVTEVLNRRLNRVRKLRYTVGFDPVKETSRLFEDIQHGELAAATRSSKRTACAWCARIVSGVDIALSRMMIAAANQFGEGDENRIAEAFQRLHGDQNRAGALQLLSGLNSPIGRSASFIVASKDETPDAGLAWLDKSGLTIRDLDPDGKFLVIQRRLEAGQWNRAIADADTLSSDDFDASPVLITAAASAHLSAAIHDQLKSAILHLPLDLSGFQLANDEAALARRRLSKGLYERAAKAFAELGFERGVAIAEDYALWLGLRDASTRDESLRLLRESMASSLRSLRRVPFALQFGVKLEFDEVERAIEREMTLAGGRSAEAAIARFALAQAKKTPAEVANYIQKHRDQLAVYFHPDWIGAVLIEALARSGQVSEARSKWNTLKIRLERADADALKKVIDEAGSEDPVSLREAQYVESKSLSDLIVLVEMLKEKRGWPKLAIYAGALFEETKDVSALRTYVIALSKESRFTEIERLAAQYCDMFERGGLLGQLGWAHFRLGHMAEAADVLSRLGTTAENPKDRWLGIHLAVATGDWISVSGMIEEEWADRENLSARELLRAGQLAALSGSARSKHLVKEAARKANGDPAILITCYSEATNSGWEDDPETHEWLEEAAKRSGPDGPVQRVTLRQLLDMAPDWGERQKDIWNELSIGKVPMFAAGLVLNRSLLNMYLNPALSNLDQADARRRQLVFAFSGARRPVLVTARRLALDPTALLTLALLGLLREVCTHFDRIVIPANTLSWLLEEQRRVRFHQPSIVRRAFELKRLLDNGALGRFEPVGGVKAELEQEVGDELAQMISAAHSLADDVRQHIVIRSFPLHRVGTLMDQIADISGYENQIAGVSDVVAALRRSGGITAVEEERARTYLSLHEIAWPHSPSVKDGAVLYLDGLSVTYLQHLRLLDRLKAAGFKAVIASSELADGDALVNHEAFAGAAGSVVEDIRDTLAEFVVAGRVVFGAFPQEGEGNEKLRNHPSTSFFELASVADAFVVDDRALNVHQIVNTPDGPKPIVDTVDLLMTLRQAEVLTPSQVNEYLTKLRRAGMIFVPIVGDELVRHLVATDIEEGRIVETAELRAIRESILRVRMTDVLQLRLEHVWLDDTIRALVAALKAQWSEDVPEAVAVARSNWILPLLDIRKWAHRLVPTGGNPQQKYAAGALLLTSLPGARAEVRERYWRWLQDAMLTRMKEEQDPSFDELLALVRGSLEDGCRRITSRRDQA